MTGKQRNINKAIAEIEDKQKRLEHRRRELIQQLEAEREKQTQDKVSKTTFDTVSANMDTTPIDVVEERIITEEEVEDFGTVDAVKDVTPTEIETDDLGKAWETSPSNVLVVIDKMKSFSGRSTEATITKHLSTCLELDEIIEGPISHYDLRGLPPNLIMVFDSICRKLNLKPVSVLQ